MTNPLKIVTNGILNENPTFVQCIGLCPTLAVSTSVMNGMGMPYGHGKITNIDNSE